MSHSKDFEELFASLNAHGVRALIVGGYAFAYHARPRYTKDIDVWIEPTFENAGCLLQALEEFGFGGLGLTTADFTEPGRFVQLGFPPNRIDILTSIPGVSFEEAWEHRVEDSFGDHPVAYLGLDDLLRNKMAAGRPQDLADVVVLKQLSQKRRS